MATIRVQIRHISNLEVGEQFQLNSPTRRNILVIIALSASKDKPANLRLLGYDGQIIPEPCEYPVWRGGVPSVGTHLYRS
jgi:hypothetical protein